MLNAGSHLALAREHFDGSRWQQACAEFAAADHLEPLGVDDLDRSAEAAQISGRIDETLGALARAFEMHASAGEIHAAARAAYWLWSAHVFARGEFALANGWVVRARTLADRHGSASDGWLLVPEAYAHLGNADFEAAAGLLHRAVERGIAAGDVDLVTIASVMRGRALLKSGAMDAMRRQIRVARAGVAVGEGRGDQAADVDLAHAVGALAGEQCLGLDEVKCVLDRRLAGLVNHGGGLRDSTPGVFGDLRRTTKLRL